MDNNVTLILFVVLSFPVAALVISNIKLWIELKAMQKSTHQIAYIDPMSQSFTQLSEDQKQELQKDPFGNLM